jgi:hypothetical protein
VHGRMLMTALALVHAEALLVQLAMYINSAAEAGTTVYSACTVDTPCLARGS